MLKQYWISGLVVALLGQFCVTEAETTSCPGSPKKQAVVSVYQIALSNVAGLPDQPIQDLGAALNNHPNTHTFKITWDFVVGSTALSSALRYDRPSHKLYYYLFGWAMTHDVRQYVVYSGVTDATLHKLGKQISPISLAVHSALPLLLPRYGCKEHQLRWPGDP
ncbi:MAG TPA: hypothetical protein VKU00_12705 [Chthonomonadaceae bacterium]|nr:hypothetical protein [Chthonomonadaceae bacterium]